MIKVKTVKRDPAAIHAAFLAARLRAERQAAAERLRQEAIDRWQAAREARWAQQKGQPTCQES